MSPTGQYRAAAVEAGADGFLAKSSFLTETPIGLALGGVDFTNLFVSLSGQAYATLAAAKPGTIKPSSQ